jgi:hypothetical protein
MTRYYYAGGKRRELEPATDRIAIDTRGATAAGLGDEVRKLSALSKLPSGMVIVDPKSLAAGVRSRFETADATAPVYRSGSAFVVLLPEVRVEFDGEQRDATVRALDQSPVPAEITDDTPERLSLRPRSGSAADALDLANYLHEHAHPAASSVRMLQVVPKRDVQR